MKTLLFNDKVLRTSVVMSTGMASLVPSFARAEDTSTGVGANCADPTATSNPLGAGADCSKSSSNSSSLFGAQGTFHTIANVLIYIVGAVSVIMLIIGGLRYVISQGNKENVTQAKDTILYAVIGIIVAILAYAIVNFVISSIAPGGGGTT